MPDDQILTGQEVYDIIMAGIEPDLVNDNLPLLDEQYANETEAEKAERMQRYQRAFAKYDEEFAAFMQKLQGEVHAVKKEVRKSAEVEDREQEAQQEQDLLSKIESA